MTPLLILIGILLWIALIITGILQDAKKEEQATVKQVVKEFKEKLPEVFLEPISDYQLKDMFGTVRKKGDRYVSICGYTRRRFRFTLDTTSFKILDALSPIQHINTDRYWHTTALELYKRPIYDASVTMYITYFSDDLVFNNQLIYLKRQEVGYTCESEGHNKALQELKEFFENSDPMPEHDYDRFKAKADELNRQEKDNRVKEIVEQVFEYHIQYNKKAVSYNTEKAVPITSIGTFYNFCELSKYTVPESLKAEVTNYLYILFGVDNDN